MTTDAGLLSPDQQEATQPLPVSFWQAFLFWLKLGFISFGGPAVSISIEK